MQLALSGFAPGRRKYLPLDEAHPARPEEAYSLSKLVGEEIADAAARLEPSVSIASLRLHRVVFPGEHKWPLYPDPAGGAKSLWGYVDIRDVVAACLKALEAPFRGHEVFFICARDTGTDVPTRDLLERFFPNVPLRRSLSPHEGLFDVAKAARVLGWEPRHSWRPVVGEG